MKGLLVFLAFLLSGISAAQAENCNRFAVTITTTPVLYQWTSALEKAEGLLDRPPHQADTVLLGDSLLAFWPTDLADTQFGKGRVWNFAVGGSRTQHILWQLDRLSSAAAIKPREVIVLIGTNNLSDEKLPACAITEGIKTVIARTRETWPGATLHVMGIPPRGSDFHFRDKDRKAINDTVRHWMATQPGMHYFEVDDLVMTCGQYAGVTVASAGNTALTGSRCENYADDFGHFRRPGYDVIFQALRGH